jgi:RHS repeat-associated protein
VRQAVDETGAVVAYREFDPYGNPVDNGVGDPYGYTGEWWEDDVGLLHLRARWYLPETGTFLSRDVVESEPPYLYVGGNPVNATDPSGFTPNCQSSKCRVELMSTTAGGRAGLGHFAIAHTDRTGKSGITEAAPSKGVDIEKIIEKVKQGNLDDLGNPLYWDPIRHPYSTDSGIIKALIGSSSTPDIIQEYKRRFQPWSVVVAEGEEVCNKWQCLKEAMEQIEQNEIGYRLLGPNSNSAAISVLRKCQLPWWNPGTTLINTTERVHAGWSLYLLGDIANRRSYRKPFYDDLLNPPYPLFP